MSKQRKLNKLLSNWPNGVVYTTHWLKSQGYSHALLSRYKTSGWIKSIGSGAVIRAGDTVRWLGAVHALQKQLNLKIHVGGKTALALQGRSHFLSLGKESISIYGAPGELLPKWFRTFDWSNPIEFTSTKLFPHERGLDDFGEKQFSILISSPERAIFELLHLVPQTYSFETAFTSMVGLVNLRPKVMQEMFENCTSIKAKRLVALLGDELGHPWMKRIDFDRINLGSGRRSLVKGGKTHAKYLLTVPESILSKSRA